MFVQEIWRYPVKSMAGEMLPEAAVTDLGIGGDRIIQVYNGRGRIATSRTYPGLLGMKAVLDKSGEVLVDGRSWDDPAVLRAVKRVVDPKARLLRNETLDRFDILPLLVATDGAIAAFGRDRRRLRPNVIVGGVEGLAEREWQGQRLLVGDLEIGLHDLRGRCIMTTFDPDTLAHDPGVLRDIVKRFGGKLALNAEVLRGGTIQVGQEVMLRPIA